MEEPMQGFLTRIALGISVFCCPWLLSAASPTEVLFLVQGGNNSCNTSSRSDVPPLGIKMYPRFEALLKTLKTQFPQLKPIVLSGCLYRSAPPDGDVDYVISSQASKLRTGDTRSVQRELETLLKAKPGIPVFFIGHSYGAWMSMYFTQELGKNFSLQGLFTLDPIGPECGAFGVVFGSSDCHQAPTDLDNKTIKKRAATWVNFYQEEDSWLSSSEIPEAENHLIEFEWGPHSDINRDARVWKRIQEVVLKALKP
jgi:pimeloyl-ACP methyl ester carboxylesterase